jgi:hypothetical protein
MRPLGINTERQFAMYITPPHPNIYSKMLVYTSQIAVMEIGKANPARSIIQQGRYSQAHRS